MNNNKQVLIQQIKDIVWENNYFNTLPGERIRDFYGLQNIQAAISFSGRSKNQKCYRLSSESDSDQIYITHLYIDKYGNLKIQLSTEDTDEFTLLLHPTGEPIENYDCGMIREWIDLLTF